MLSAASISRGTQAGHFRATDGGGCPCNTGARITYIRSPRINGSTLLESTPPEGMLRFLALWLLRTYYGAKPYDAYI